MTKHYCDVCRREMTASDHERIKRRLGDVTVEVMVAVLGIWNGGEVCHECVQRTVREGEPVE